MSLSGRRGRVQVHGKDAEPGALLLDAVHDLHEVPHRAGDPIQLRDRQNVAVPEVVERSHELPAFSDAADLLGEDLLAAGSLEVPSLGVKAGHLVNCRGPRVSDLHSGPRLRAP